ncbi:MAG TPA: glycerophosphodiester phosphodiesterase [Candidatus Binataceae bacterium]|nr:glycerophosphodiester phosphodiesterase [Candidatus Binataceae bacterium]
MRPSLDSDFFTESVPRIFGHRGSAGTHPENTMPSFQAAVDLGAHYLETDVHLTRDGEVVVSHDDNLERTCGHPGLIAELDYGDIAAMDAGFSFSLNGINFPFRAKAIQVPRLTEVLAAFPRMRFNIDLKPEHVSIIEPTLKVIDAAGMRRMVLLTSEYQPRLDEIRAAASEIPTGLGYLEIAAFMQATAARDASYHPPGDAIQIPTEYHGWKLATPETVEMAHRHGIEVHIWTVNEEPEMRAMFALGVDGIMSDFPGLALKVIELAR